jgi:outer membrane biosynthesis protein TonB
MREIFKAYSLSFLIHSLLLFGFFLLTQRLVPSEKRLIEIDLSLENVQRQPFADLSQKAQPLPARPPQTQPVPQANIPPPKEEIKSSTAKQLKQEEKQSQVQSPPKPAEAEIREIQTSQAQTCPTAKRRKRVKLQNTQGREKGLSKPKKFPKSLQVKGKKQKVKSWQMKTKTQRKSSSGKGSRSYQT